MVIDSSLEGQGSCLSVAHEQLSCDEVGLGLEHLPVHGATESQSVQASVSVHHSDEGHQADANNVSSIESSLSSLGPE